MENVLLKNNKHSGSFLSMCCVYMIIYTLTPAMSQLHVDWLSTSVLSESNLLCKNDCILCKPKVKSSLMSNIFIYILRPTDSLKLFNSILMIALTHQVQGRGCPQRGSQGAPPFHKSYPTFEGWEYYKTLTLVYIIFREPFILW